MTFALSLFFSTLLGFLGINALRFYGRVDPVIHLIAAVGLGLALSAHILFYTLFIFGQYNAAAVFTIHFLALGMLIYINFSIYRNNLPALFPHFPADRASWLGFVLLSLLLIPLWREAHFYPFGGWDAWACWNLKAKFIFLGGEKWKDMFSPDMWRSNNQYPFLLPLMNAWAWGLDKTTLVTAPMLHAILFSFLTAATMFWGTNKFSKNIYSILPPIVLFSIPFINTLSISQYSDVVLAFYLLGSLSCLVMARRETNTALAVIAGLMAGVMSFTKTEGSLACAIILALSIPFLNLHKSSKKLLMPFLFSLVISALPAVLFTLFWKSQNMSFINGLFSAEHPVSWMRLKAILVFLTFEFISIKWNGFWFLLVCGLLMSWTKCIKEGLFLVPAFLCIFLSGALAYYFINTHYEIIWWMGTTLNRILYTLLPVITWWVFASTLMKDEKK